MTNFLQEGRAPLILASASAARRKLLEGAGLSFSTKAAGLDEAAMRTAMGLEGTVEPTDIAEVLARAVVRAAQQAESLGGVPAARDLEK